MGVYRKVGEINGEDQYRQLDSRRNGHVLHLQLKINLETDQFQWQTSRMTIVSSSKELFGPF